MSQLATARPAHESHRAQPVDRLRVAFVVQGEGRGHLTQALALAAALRDRGHQVCEVWLGSGPEWPTPSYFLEGVGAPVARFTAPTHVPTPDRRAVSASRTARASVLRLPAFVASGLRMLPQLTPARCDLVVSFYDVISGFVRLFQPRPVPTVAVGHHYLIRHPAVPPVPAGPIARAGMQVLTRMTEWRTRLRLALSFRPLPGADAPRDLRVCPPLLRPGLRSLDVSDEGFLLCYTLNPGHAEAVVVWQRRHPEVEVHIHVAGGADALRVTPGPGCHVHGLDGRAFLQRLARCRAYAGSAGFESLCEARYLGKPVLAVPTPGQIEQGFNAADAQAAGVAQAGTFDDLDRFWCTARPPDPDAVARFRAWVDSGPRVAVEALEEAAGVARGA